MTAISLPTFLAGVCVGLAVAAPIGPMGILCIQQTLTFGLLAGLATGAAAATVQVTYGLFAILGFSPATTTSLGAGAPLLSVVSAGLLFWFALRVLQVEVTVGSLATRQPHYLILSYRDALVFGYSNPLTPVLFFAAFPVLTSAADLANAQVLVVGVFSGVVGWYVVLSTTVALLRQRLPAQGLKIANKASGLTLAALGVLTLANAFGVGLH